MTRRQRLRVELIADIKNAARRRLTEAGPAELSLRGIARDVGMSPASLYTYFRGLDDVITALIVDSFDAQAGAIRDAAAGTGSIQSRLRRATLAYRDWARGHPEEFRLLYESPIAGYHAPEDGPTVDAAIGVMAPFIELLHEAWTTGEIPPPTPGPPIDTSVTAPRVEVEIDPDWLRVGIVTWAQFHGFVSLELNGHIPPEAKLDAVYEHLIDDIATRLGFPDRGAT